VPELAHLRIFILRYTNVLIVIIIMIMIIIIIIASALYQYTFLLAPGEQIEGIDSFLSSCLADEECEHSLRDSLVSISKGSWQYSTFQPITMQDQETKVASQHSPVKTDIRLTASFPGQPG